MLQRTPESANAPFTLFQPEGTQNWSMRYSLGGRQIKKSLSTADYDVALQRANENFHEQKYRHKQGLSHRQHQFSEVAEEFIEKFCAEAERGERSHYHPTFWPPIIRRFPVAYFGDKADHDRRCRTLSGMAKDLLDGRTGVEDREDPRRASGRPHIHPPCPPEDRCDRHHEGRDGDNPRVVRTGRPLGVL
ncbi:hypothetical protein HFO21_34580 [Rhizobium laguerreae]|uniref:hypothetical protein n=1 Tax=Rhizobium laguerreae TaxID=1076926 RepID=UPI001C929D5A|nr:hypothetical protein [Rhizobium laguerreae]MBY3219423.1 hypothetical protein [Rhizobium laguerreae]